MFFKPDHRRQPFGQASLRGKYHRPWLDRKWSCHWQSAPLTFHCGPHRIHRLAFSHESHRLVFSDLSLPSFLSFARTEEDRWHAFPKRGESEFEKGDLSRSQSCALVLVLSFDVCCQLWSLVSGSCLCDRSRDVFDGGGLGLGAYLWNRHHSKPRIGVGLSSSPEQEEIGSPDIGHRSGWHLSYLYCPIRFGPCPGFDHRGNGLFLICPNPALYYPDPLRKRFLWPGMGTYLNGREYRGSPGELVRGLPS